MKLRDNFCKMEILKMLKVGDIVCLLISILGIIISNVEMIQAINVIGGIRYIIYNIIICSILVIINIYNFLNRREIIISNLRIETLEENNRNLIEVNDHARCFKHDFNNILQAIDGYIILDDMNSLQKYFKSLLKECNHMNVIETLNYKMLDNPAIYGVLLNKYKIAEENDIKMNIDVLISCDKLKEKSYVISRMLGILLDNALEATNECEEKLINVQFIKEDKRNKNLIIIENTYKDKDIDTTKIFEKNYTTKKNKKNSGLGLWKVHDILKKDHSLDLFTTKDDNMFRQEIEIYE